MNKGKKKAFLQLTTQIQACDQIVLLDGRVISINIGELFSLRDTDGRPAKLKFDCLTVGNPFHQSLYSCLKSTLSTHSISYVRTITHALAKWFDVGSIGQRDLIGIKELNSLNQISAAYRPFVIPILRRIKELNLPGLSDEVADFLEHDYRWEERESGAYFYLITNDPERGALTEQEIRNIHRELNRAYAEGRISHYAYTLCWFFIGTGVRPIQASRMKVSDVLIHNREAMEVTLRIPLAKGEKTTSVEHWARRAPTVLAECLISYLDTPEMQNKSASDALFPAEYAGYFGRLVTRTIEGLDTFSERLGAKIPITPYRFRYTLATRALAQGATDFEVARLLTHRSTACIQYYRASMPELQKPIRQAIGKEMTFFANAFQGKVLGNLEEATRAGDPNAVIVDFLRLMGRAVGACGTCAMCYQDAPIACLTDCPYFEPLLSAPWEMLLDSLREDQEREAEPKIRDINESAMSTIKGIMARRDVTATTVGA